MSSTGLTWVTDAGVEMKQARGGSALCLFGSGIWTGESSSWQQGDVSDVSAMMVIRSLYCVLILFESVAGVPADGSVVKTCLLIHPLFPHICSQNQSSVWIWRVQVWICLSVRLYPESQDICIGQINQKQPLMLLHPAFLGLSVIWWKNE